MSYRRCSKRCLELATQLLSSFSQGLRPQAGAEIFEKYFKRENSVFCGGFCCCSICCCAANREGAKCSAESFASPATSADADAREFPKAFYLRLISSWKLRESVGLAAAVSSVRLYKKTGCGAASRSCSSRASPPSPSPRNTLFNFMSCAKKGSQGCSGGTELLASAVAAVAAAPARSGAAGAPRPRLSRIRLPFV